MAELTIEILAEEIQPFLRKAAVKLSQELKIEGFRPGKAPYEIVKQKCGEMAIMEEALDDIIAKTYFDALAENKIISIGQPKIDLEKMAPGNPLVYKATVAILPKVKVGDYQKISLKRESVSVKAEEVEKIINDIRRLRAKEKLVERELKTGDKAEINFDIFLDKVPIEHGRHEKYPITIGEGRFIPGFEEQLAGMKAGETKEFELKFPVEYFQKNLAGRNCEFKVKCNAVYEIELPELNDGLAQEISGNKFQSLAELKENVAKNLEEEERAKQEQKLETEMFDQLLKISEFEEIPETLIENEAHKMIHELQDNIERQGLKFEDYLKNLKKSHEDLDQEFQPQAEKRAKTAILCREIYQEQKMAVTDDEVLKEIEEILKSYPANPEIRRQLETETYKDYLRNAIGNRRVTEYLKSIIIKD